MSDEIECPDCNGEGFLRCGILPTGPVCNCCRGKGWREMTEDEANDAAANAYSDMCEGEPPLSFAERTEMDRRRDAQWGVT